MFNEALLYFTPPQRKGHRLECPGSQVSSEKPKRVPAPEMFWSTAAGLDYVKLSLQI